MCHIGHRCWTTIELRTRDKSKNPYRDIVEDHWIVDFCFQQHPQSRFQEQRQIPPPHLIYGIHVFVIHPYLVFSCQLFKVIQVQFSFKNLIVLPVILANKQNCPLIKVTPFLLPLLILYILIFGVLHLFPLRGDLNILSYLWMIFLDILGFICFTIGLNLCLFTKHFIK